MPKELNDNALKAKFRHLLWEVAGFDCFQVVGYRGQKPMVFRHQEGEAHKRLLDELLRETAAELDAIPEEDVYRDSDGYDD